MKARLPRSPTAGEGSVRVGRPADAREHDADVLAHDALGRNAQHGVAARQGARAGETGPAPAPLAEGQPLAPDVRTDFETRFGHDFSRVRVHADKRAAGAARTLEARAFTLREHIAFGSGQFAPHTRAGRALLAHELAHVVQERRSPDGVLRRAPVSGYEAQGEELGRDVVESFTHMGYWNKLLRANGYQIVHMGTDTDTRLKADAEERDAVLSVAWRVRPKDRKTPGTRVVTIPARSKVKGSKPVMYQLKFVPKGKVTNVEIDFIGEGGLATAKPAPTPAAGFTPTPVTVPTSHVGFPGKDLKGYWKGHAEEKAQVFNWIENEAPATFEQVITTKTTKEVKKATVTREVSFHIEGSKKGGAVDKLKIEFLGAVSPTTETPPADYADKTSVDVELERLQAPDPKKKKKPLGKITGLDTVPASERASVKVAIRTYFKGGTRDAEVDALIPIADTTKVVRYTLRFEPDTNDVVVQRIGEATTGGKLDPTGLDIGRVRGFADHSKTVASLSGWLKKRYPGITASGKTVDELRANANKVMQRDAGSAKWFKDNYDITVLDAAKGAERLKTKHGRSEKLTDGMSNFTADELRQVEFALQPIADPIRNLLKGTHLARQEVLLELAGKKVVRRPKTAGQTSQNGTDRTIVLYDRMALNADVLFVGGTEGVRPEPTRTVAHEFGHVVEEQEGIKAAFAAFVKKHKIKPITRYARGSPVKESFTEAFSLFVTDPEWMRTNLPVLFDWFEELSKTGKPPP